jgi:signal peptidase II
MNKLSKIRDRKTQIFILGLVALGVVIVDQLTKWWVVANVAGKPPLVVIEGFVRLRYTENRGAAFGFFQGWAGALSIVAIAVVFAIVYSASKLGGTNKLGLIALGLITGGALGNLLDRLRVGYVVDFVDVYGPRITIDHTPYTFPVFNAADSSITIGAILLIGTLLFAGDLTASKEIAPDTEHPEGSQSTLPTRLAAPNTLARPKEPTPAGWAGLAVMLAGLLLVALRMSRERS